jgi:hypothetical protein
MNDTDGANNLNTSRAARVAAWVTSHDSKHTKKNRERSKNHAELNSVAPGRRALARVRSLQGKTRSTFRP